jgi:hypothetical protein
MIQIEIKPSFQLTNQHAILLGQMTIKITLSDITKYNFDYIIMCTSTITLCRLWQKKQLQNNTTIL